MSGNCNGFGGYGVIAAAAAVAVAAAAVADDDIAGSAAGWHKIAATVSCTVLAVVGFASVAAAAGIAAAGAGIAVVADIAVVYSVHVGVAAVAVVEAVDEHVDSGAVVLFVVFGGDAVDAAVGQGLFQNPVKCSQAW